MIDVAIVGAGLSGLVCARALIAGGRDAIVVEARDAVGGRLRSQRIGGAIHDLGGHWLSDGQPRLAARCAELGIATTPQRRDGAAVLAVDAGPRRHVLGRMFAALARRRQLAGISRMIAQAARAPDPAWDATSLGEWLERSVGDPATRAEVALHAELTFAADPRELSLLCYLAGLGATDGWGDPFGGKDGGHERRLVGGTQGLCTRLAAAIGDRIRLATPVSAIDARDDAVELTTSHGPIRARRIVLALPPACARAIAWTPPPPADVARVIAASRPGAVVKVIATYPRAWWRDAGLSGEAYQSRGLIRATVDGTAIAVDGTATAVDGTGADGGDAALVGFVVAGEAVRWNERSFPDRTAQVIGELVGLFGEAAAAPSDVVAMDWSADRWSGGCVAGLPPGVAIAASAWRGPFGRVHVAGTESAARWPGFMEGAIDAGERAAAEVLAAGD